MNSMASNIEGFTVHSWGEVEFMKEGIMVSSKQTGMAYDFSSMRTKCENLRFVLIDEIENVGAGTLGDLEQHMFDGARPDVYKWRRDVEAAFKHRYCGGVNLIFFWGFLAASTSRRRSHHEQ